MFVASASERGVVVSDLSSFRRSGVIALGGVPDQVLSARGKVFALCFENQTVAQIDPISRAITATTSVGGKIAAAALTTDGRWLAVAVSQPAGVVMLDTASGKVARRAVLPGSPHAIAASLNQLAALTTNSKATSLARISVSDGALLGVSPIGAGEITAIGYRKDGGTIFVGASDSREIVSLNSANAAVLARLPVPIRPARFCAHEDGGQVFVTGADMEPRLVIFSPYQNQIDQTVYAGRALSAVAAAPVRNLLFLSNASAGDVTIMDIFSRRVIASIRTGGSPGEILVAPAPRAGGEEEYAFVVDTVTGDVSVLHIPVILQKSQVFIAEHPKPVFAVFHGGANPQSAVIVPYTA